MGTPRRVATARARHAHGTRHAAGGESKGSHGRAEAGERQGRSRHRRSARASATRTFSVPRRHMTRTRRTTTPQRGSRPDACLHSHARVPCGLHGLRIRPPLRSARPAGTPPSLRALRLCRGTAAPSSVLQSRSGETGSRTQAGLHVRTSGPPGGSGTSSRRALA